MGIAVAVILIVLHLAQRVGVGNPRRFRHLIPSAGGVEPIAERRIERGSRVEKSPWKRNRLALLNASEDTKVDGEPFVEGFLRDVELGDVVAIGVFLHDHPMLHHADRRPIVALVASSTKGDVMVLHPSRAFDGSPEVGIATMVRDRHAQIGRRLTKLATRKHSDALVDGLPPYVTAVTDVESFALSLLGGHLNNARSAARTVLRRFRSVFQDGETLDICGIDGAQGGQIGRHAVDDDKRIVASRERRCTTHAHRVEHGFLIRACMPLA